MENVEPHLVKRAVAAGEDPNQRFGNGRTLLHLMAATKGPVDEAMALVLIKHGADPRLRDDDRLEPLALAFQNRQWQLVRVLVWSGVPLRNFVLRRGITDPSLRRCWAWQRYQLVDQSSLLPPEVLLWVMATATRKRERDIVKPLI